MTCPFDENDLILTPDEDRPLIILWHCPGCGNEFTLDGEVIDNSVLDETR